MKAKLVLFNCICAAHLLSCDVYDYRLITINKTQTRISVEAYQDTIPEYPSRGKKEFYLEKAIAPGESFSMRRSGKEGWPNFIFNSKNESLNLFIFYYDSLLKYNSIDLLIENRAYKRKVISRKQLNDDNWKVVID